MAATKKNKAVKFWLVAIIRELMLGPNPNPAMPENDVIPDMEPNDTLPKYRAIIAVSNINKVPPLNTAQITSIVNPNVPPPLIKTSDIAIPAVGAANNANCLGWILSAR